jgi:DNA topoisomerase-1
MYKKQYKKKSKINNVTPPDTNYTPKKSKYLIIVESPSKCKKIEDYLGSDYTCIASKGHLRTIDGLKSIKLKNQCEIQYTNIKEKQKHIEFMHNIIQQYTPNSIFLATDDDREGEAIAWNICQIFNFPIETTPRIIFHEITKSAIQESIQNPRLINMPLVYSQQARMVLDVIVGCKISPFLWKFINKDTNNNTNNHHSSFGNALSAGRCQTPALRLIYDRQFSLDKENQKIDIGGEYKTTAFFYSDYSSPFILDHSFKTEESMRDFLEKSKTHQYKLYIKPSKENTYHPPKPFHTSRLLQTISHRMNLSPKQIMNYLQHLYQNGHITYMRTESTKYSKEFVKKAHEYILKEWNQISLLGNKTLIENVLNNNPHEAIRVTHIETKNVFSKEFEKDGRYNAIYKIIWKNTVESCMSPAIYKATPICMSAPDNYNYIYNLEQPIFFGWHILSKNNNDNIYKINNLNGENIHCNDSNKSLEYMPDDLLENTIETDTHENDTYNTQNKIKSNTNLTNKLFFFENIKSPDKHNLIECTISFPNKSNYYTEASLIQKLEELGIGRPSTYSMLVDTIQERNYVKKTNIPGINIKCNEFSLDNHENIKIKTKEKIVGSEKNKLVIQPTGVIVIEFLLKYFESLFSYEYTKNMEIYLDDISSNINDTASSVWWHICKSCYDEIKEKSKTLNQISKSAISLDEKHELVFNMNGPVIQTKKESISGSSTDLETDFAKEYKSVRKDILIDLDKLMNNEYTLEDLLEIKNSYLGNLENTPIYIRTGKYGAYLEWGDKKESLKSLLNEKKDINIITYNDAVRIFRPDLLKDNGDNGNCYNGNIDSDNSSLDTSSMLWSNNVDSVITNNINNIHGTRAPPINKNILRIINTDMSIRRGKFGAYIYYKTSEMKEPKFLSLAKFKKGFINCNIEELKSWIQNTHNISF